MLKTIDNIDRMILQALQQNARISIADLATRVNLSPTPCLRRLRKLEQQGYIRQYTALLDNKKLGLHVAALAFVKLEKNSAENGRAFEAAVQRFHQVTECCVLTGTHDYVLRVLTEDLETYERFIKEDLANVPKVADIESTIILNQVIPGQPPAHQ